MSQQLKEKTNFHRRYRSGYFNCHHSRNHGIHRNYGSQLTRRNWCDCRIHTHYRIDRLQYLQNRKRLTMETNSQKLLNRINTENNVVQNALGSDNEVIQCACVRGGHLNWKYEEWVQHSEPCVRKLIAENYPEYVPLLPCETDWELIEVGNYLLKQTEPELDVLEKFLAHVERLNYNLKVIALQLKHETLTRKLTAIEKTMSLQQLWESNSPFWTEKLPGTKVVDVLRAFSLSEQSQEEFDFEGAYDKVTNSFTGRLTSSRPYLNIYEKLHEEPTCNKILTSLIY